MASLDQETNHRVRRRGRHAWKVALFATVFCYPIGALTGTWINYARLTARPSVSVGDKLDMVHSSNRIAMGVGAVVWLIAVAASILSTRVEDPVERQVGRFALTLVIAATVLYLLAGGFTQLLGTVATS